MVGVLLVIVIVTVVVTIVVIVITIVVTAPSSSAAVGRTTSTPWVVETIVPVVLEATAVGFVHALSRVEYPSVICQSC